MLRPISPTPPSAVTRRAPAASGPGGVDSPSFTKASSEHGRGAHVGGHSVPSILILTFMSILLMLLTWRNSRMQARLDMPPKLIALIIKELLSAFRDPRTRIAFIVPPIMQVFLYAYAATLEVTNAPIGVYNEDWGQYSRQLISRFEEASAFSTITYFKSEKEIQPAIDSQRVLAVSASRRIFRAKWRRASP